MPEPNTDKAVATLNELLESTSDEVRLQAAQCLLFHDAGPATVKEYSDDDLRTLKADIESELADRRKARDAEHTT